MPEFIHPLFSANILDVDINTIGGPFILAPLAGYTDKAFREIARGMGADAAVSEMVSAEGLARNGEKTKALLERFPGEDRLIIQIFGPSDDPVRRAMDNLLAYNPTAIDINCGCPVPKVVKTGAGSALMKNPPMIGRIIKAIRERTDIPVSVKFRLGWNAESINYLEFADAAADAGASMLTLHARTRAQGYSGTADRNAFRTLTSHLEGSGILVFGSGDVFSPEDALALIEDCHLDGVMFARGAIGNPFIFRETKELVEKGSYEKPSTEEKVSTALRHLHLMIRYYGENVGCREMRKHLMAYIKGIPGSSHVKNEIGRAVTEEEMERALGKLLS